MDGRFNTCPLPSDPEAPPAATTHISFPSFKRSRRSVQKRVVSIPIDASRPRGAGDGPPPSDSWAWRKYGQKPIKGSPYPRGYYRCSSAKGCPAKKQVERSRVDPNVIVVTYAAEHNHPWPLPKNHHGHGHHHHPKPPLPPPAEPPAPAPEAEAVSDPAESAGEEKLSAADLIAEEVAAAATSPSLVMPEVDDDLFWFPDVGLASSTTATSAAVGGFFCGPISGEEGERWGCTSGGGEGEEEVFAGLGELPECSVVFRRGITAASTG